MLIILKRTIITKTNMNDWDKFIFYKYFIFYENNIFYLNFCKIKLIIKYYYKNKLFNKLYKINILNK